MFPHAPQGYTAQGGDWAPLATTSPSPSHDPTDRSSPSSIFSHSRVIISSPLSYPSPRRPPSPTPLPPSIDPCRQLSPYKVYPPLPPLPRPPTSLSLSRLTPPPSSHPSPVALPASSFPWGCKSSNPSSGEHMVESELIITIIIISQSFFLVVCVDCGGREVGRGSSPPWPIQGVFVTHPRPVREPGKAKAEWGIPRTKKKQKKQKQKNNTC